MENDSLEKKLKRSENLVAKLYRDSQGIYKVIELLINADLELVRIQDSIPSFVLSDISRLILVMEGVRERHTRNISEAVKQREELFEKVYIEKKGEDCE